MLFVILGFIFNKTALTLIPTFRIAPTPSGFLHIGNACNALLTWQLAQQHRGQILLRIDDLDAERKKTSYLCDIFETLDWLGIEWELGPMGPDDFEQNWSQAHRAHLYENMLLRLAGSGFVYACALSRSQLQDATPESRRDQKRSLDASSGISWRVETTPKLIVFSDTNNRHYTINLNETMPDFVVRRRDGIAAYQVASLADDIHFGVTHIVRGQDLLPSTAAQLFLAELLGVSSLRSTAWLHHPLITDEAGQKLSKSAGSMALQGRKTSKTRDQIRRIVDGWRNEER